MIVKLKEENPDYPDLTKDQTYFVIGIEADDYLFEVIDSREPSTWITEYGDDGERYSYPPVLNEVGFFKVLDEELVLGFMDINPASRGHLLVIPKRHAGDIFEISEADLAAVTGAAKRCARAVKEALKAEGVTVLQLNGRAAGQGFLISIYISCPDGKRAGCQYPAGR